MLDEILNRIGDIEIFIAGAGAIVFAFSYATFFNWRATAPGRALMYFVISLIALFVLNALGRWIGDDYPFRPYIRFAVYSAIAVTVWHLVAVLWRGWRRGDPRPLHIEKRESSMAEHLPTETPNVVVENPNIRRGANIVLGVVGILVGTAVVVDGSTDAFDISAITTPIFTGYAYLASIFGLAVTLPNIPRQ